MKYILNESTGTLHINGGCWQTEHKFVKTKVFKTYNEAIEYCGTSVKMCKSCERKKEEVLKESL